MHTIARVSISINQAEGGYIEVTCDGKLRSFAGMQGVVVTRYVSPEGLTYPNSIWMRYAVRPKNIANDFNYVFDLGVITEINSENPPNNVDDAIAAISSIMQSAAGGEGGGSGGGSDQEIFISSLHFKGGTSAEDPLIPRGFQGTDGLDYSAAASELVELLPQAAAPTAPVNDDDEDTMSFTKVFGFPTYSSYEYTLNGGMSVTALPSNSLVPVGNVNKVAGQVGVRVKGTISNDPSEWLFNTEDFTYSAPVETPLSSGWHGGYDSSFGNVGNLLTPNSIYAQSVAGFKIPQGQEGYVKWAVPTNDYGGVMLDPGDSIGGIGGATLSAWFGNNQMIARYGGNYFGSGGGSIPPGPDSYLRLRADLVKIYAEYSTDGAVSWTAIPDAENTRPDADLFIKTMWEILQDPPVTNQVQDIVGFNVVPV